MNPRRGAAAIRRRAYERKFRPFHPTALLLSPDVQRFVPGDVCSYRGPGLWHPDCAGCRRTIEQRRVDWGAAMRSAVASEV